MFICLPLEFSHNLSFYLFHFGARELLPLFTIAAVRLVFFKSYRTSSRTASTSWQ